MSTEWFTDKIWQDIKSDQSEVYGMKMLDAFLMLTKNLDSKHFDELNPEQKKKISTDAAIDLLTLDLIYDSDNSGVFKKRAEEMGMDVFDRFSADQIIYILGEMIPNIKSLEYASVFGNNLRKLKNARNNDWLRILLRHIKNRYNHKSGSSAELLGQLFSILKKYDLVDDETKEEISYFFGANEFSPESREIARKFLEEN